MNRALLKCPCCFLDSYMNLMPPVKQCHFGGVFVMSHYSISGYIGVKPGWTGINFPYNMSKEEFEFILAASEFMAICEQQFLRLYHFNEKTGSWCFKKSLKNFISK
ncbi:hypothetical protein Pint_27260 [Pistacia integerrima]|uniref:Uncharacterized protein n=1 Tax=Pistacia integerrima TaxID=434235 RepID=A0ACC0YUX0_9ROSI|nr:hypothetical protein Pint_27260 [Pistacia integerrima]